MSLRAFHIFFVSVAFFASLAFGYWGFRNYHLAESNLILALAIASFVGAGALMVYLPQFLKKTRQFALSSLLLTALIPVQGLACSVCVGDIDSPMVKSANAGIIFFLFVVGAVLSSFLVLFLVWARRSKRIPERYPLPAGRYN